jgi:hypothetical protein
LPCKEDYAEAQYSAGAIWAPPLPDTRCPAIYGLKWHRPVPARPTGSSHTRINDKVMQITNNYEKDVFNGDIGRVVGIEAEEQKLLMNGHFTVVRRLSRFGLAYILTVPYVSWYY